jgi:hypothetical protein
MAIRSKQRATRRSGRPSGMTCGNTGRINALGRRETPMRK